MSQRSFLFHTDQLLRIILLLWIGYFFCLALVDWWFVDRQVNVLIYYAVQMGNSFLILGITLLPWHNSRSADTLLPLCLVLMAILPSLTVHIMLRLVPSEPLSSPEGMTLRLTPLLLMGLLLTAWQYQWRHVMLFAFGTFVVNLFGIFVVRALQPVLESWLGIGIGLAGSPPTLALSTPPLIGAILISLLQMFSLLMVGAVTSVLVRHLRQQNDALEEANAQLRYQATTQIELTISRERNRMARELHDTLAHTLSGLTVQLQTVKAYWEIEPTTSQEMLTDALATTRQGLNETRRALKSLRAAPLEDLGLALAIRQLAKSTAERANLTLQLSIPEPLPTAVPEVDQCIYRVAQEAITNVGHHANAQTLSVDIKCDEQCTQLTVVDDGIGFDAGQTYPNHWGLEGMHERAQLVGGQLTIQSQSGGGTTVQLIIPEKLPEKSL